jgi:hypothetical protein
MLNILLTALSEDRARVRALAKEVVRIGDRERSLVGKELHDSIAQSLAALRYQLIAVERETQDAELAEKIRAVRHSAGDVLEQVRLLSHNVHPQILDDLGLCRRSDTWRTAGDGRSVSVSVARRSVAASRSSERHRRRGYRSRGSRWQTLRHGAPSNMRYA